MKSGDKRGDDWRALTLVDALLEGSPKLKRWAEGEIDQLIEDCYRKESNNVADKHGNRVLADSDQG